MTVNTIILDTCDLCMTVTHMQYRSDLDAWNCINCNTKYIERD